MVLSCSRNLVFDGRRQRPPRHRRDYLSSATALPILEQAERGRFVDLAQVLFEARDANTDVLRLVDRRIGLDRLREDLDRAERILRPHGTGHLDILLDSSGAGRKLLASLVASVGHEVRSVRPRRARCTACETTHVLSASWLVPRRSDDAEVIGEALGLAAAGAGHRVIARRVGRPAGTVRGWLRAARARARSLWACATRWTYALDPEMGGALLEAVMLAVRAWVLEQIELRPGRARRYTGGALHGRRWGCPRTAPCLDGIRRRKATSLWWREP